MTSEVAIDAAGPEDLATLLASRVLLTNAERQAAILRKAVASGGCLVAREATAFAGFAVWDRDFFDRPFLRLLVVEPDYRKRGVGAALVRAVESSVRTHGELFASTEAINAPMQALLAKLEYGASGSIDNVNEPGNAELVYYKRLS